MTLCDAPRFSLPDHMDADNRSEEEKAMEDLAERRDRIKTWLKDALLSSMRIECVGGSYGPDIDDYIEDVLVIINDTNLLSEAYADLQDERAAQAGE